MYVPPHIHSAKQDMDIAIKFWNLKLFFSSLHDFEVLSCPCERGIGEKDAVY
jgi:hypothetical protein